jgi:hypothetical protein
VHPKFSHEVKGLNLGNQSIKYDKARIVWNQPLPGMRIKALNKVTDFYDYEVEFVRIWRRAW